VGIAKHEFLALCADDGYDYDYYFVVDRGAAEPKLDSGTKIRVIYYGRKLTKSGEEK